MSYTECDWLLRHTLPRTERAIPTCPPPHHSVTPCLFSPPPIPQAPRWLPRGYPVAPGGLVVAWWWLGGGLAVATPCGAFRPGAINSQRSVPARSALLRTTIAEDETAGLCSSQSSRHRRGAGWGLWAVAGRVGLVVWLRGVSPASVGMRVWIRSGDCAAGVDPRTLEVYRAER